MIDDDAKQSFDQHGYVVARGLFGAEQTALFFFNGSLVHGSKPNRSARFRRAVIGHYIQGDAREVAHWYHPVLRMDGTEVELNAGIGGGPCGEWVDHDGRPVIELTGVAADPRSTE
jgi:phytanoyl-CoA hydroxylase